MNILAMLLIGFLVGLLARLFTPGKYPAGIVITTLLGIGGAIMATYLGRYLGVYQPGEISGFIGQVVGAALILTIFRFIRKP